MKLCSNNKQSEKTRSRIKKAVAVLLKTNTIEDIKITEITALSGVSRNTFYTHYKKIGDVLNDISNDLIADFESIFKKYNYLEFSTNPEPLVKELIVMCKKSSAFSEYVVFAKNQNGILQYVIDTVSNKFYNIYYEERKNNDFLVPYLVQFLIAGVAEYLYKWFKEGQKINYDDIVIQLSYLIKNTLSVLRGIKNNK